MINKELLDSFLNSSRVERNNNLDGLKESVKNIGIVKSFKLVDLELTHELFDEILEEFVEYIFKLNGSDIKLEAKSINPDILYGNPKTLQRIVDLEYGDQLVLKSLAGNNVEFIKMIYLKYRDPSILSYKALENEEIQDLVIEDKNFGMIYVEPEVLSVKLINKALDSGDYELNDFYRLLPRVLSNRFKNNEEIVKAVEKKFPEINTFLDFEEINDDNIDEIINSELKDLRRVMLEHSDRWIPNINLTNDNLKKLLKFNPMLIKSMEDVSLDLIMSALSGIEDADISDFNQGYFFSKDYKFASNLTEEDIINIDKMYPQYNFTFYNLDFDKRNYEVYLIEDNVERAFKILRYHNFNENTLKLITTKYPEYLSEVSLEQQTIEFLEWAKDEIGSTMLSRVINKESIGLYDEYPSIESEKFIRCITRYV